MKKLIYLIVALVILGLIASGCFLTVVPPTEKDEINSLTKQKPDAKPGTDFRGLHYNLNLIGKKTDWSGGGSYNNPDRHTMFVPEDTTSFINPNTNELCYTPNGFPGITIWMTQCGWGNDCDDFAVIDGNAFDDCTCEFQLAPGVYEVYIVAKAKPAKKDDSEYYTDIAGWIRYIDTELDTNYLYYKLGEIRVKKSKKWWDATDLFYVPSGLDPYGIVEVDDMWVFEYLYYLGQLENIQDEAYFWQYDNHGNKLVKVRFYKK